MAYNYLIRIELIKVIDPDIINLNIQPILDKLYQLDTFPEIGIKSKGYIYDISSELKLLSEALPGISFNVYFFFYNLRCLDVYECNNGSRATGGKITTIGQYNFMKPITISSMDHKISIRYDPNSLDIDFDISGIFSKHKFLEFDSYYSLKDLENLIG